MTSFDDDLICQLINRALEIPPDDQEFFELAGRDPHIAQHLLEVHNAALQATLSNAMGQLDQAEAFRAGTMFGLLQVFWLGFRVGRIHQADSLSVLNHEINLDGSQQGPKRTTE